MNYQKIYDEFILDRKNKQGQLSGYFERHHILPRSLGGDDSHNNLINLTPSDHFFAHILLSKIYGGGMFVALSLMSSSFSRSANGMTAKRWAYDYAKRGMSEYRKIQYSGKDNPFFGKTHSEQSILKIRKSRKGKMTGESHFAYGKPSKLRGIPLKEETKQKISRSKLGEKNPMYGKTMGSNPNYNGTIFLFKNKNTGEFFSGTQRELINKFSLEFRNVSAVVKGKRKSCGGWILEGAE